MSWLRSAMIAIAVLAPLAPANAAAAGSAKPTPPPVLEATGGSIITLRWLHEGQADHFRIYEDGVEVARHTGTSLQFPGRAWGSSHTYSVVAVGPHGRPSAPSNPATAGLFGTGVNPCRQPIGVAVTDITRTSANLRWTRPWWAQEVSVQLDGATVASTSGTSQHLSGLTPGTSHRVSIAGCGDEPTDGTTFTTPAKMSTWQMVAPDNLTLGKATETTLALRWDAPRLPPPLPTWPTPAHPELAEYRIYEGARLLATANPGTTSITLTGRYHGERHPLTVIAVDQNGDESAGTAHIDAATTPCQATPPVPHDVNTTSSAGTVRLSWQQDSAAESYTILDGRTEVTTTWNQTAVITGLAPRSRHGWRIRANLINECGVTGLSPTANTTVPTGPTARTSAPTDLATDLAERPGPGGSCCQLTWRPVPGASAYRIYDGGQLLGQATTTRYVLDAAPNTRHELRVTTVDGAGVESSLSAPVRGWVPYLPVP